MCEFVIFVVKEFGIGLWFEGEGVDEVGVIESINGYICYNFIVGDVIVKVDFVYFCFVEVEILFGNLVKVKEKLDWEFEIIVEEMCVEMIECDFK